MLININNEPVEITSESINISALLHIRNIAEGGTAVAVNDRLVTRSSWESTKLHDGDCVTIISAAYGG